MVLELTMHMITPENLLSLEMSNYPGTELKVTEDWRYSNPKMKVREEALTLLLKRFGEELTENGEPKYNNKSIYECAHDWVSQGNMRTDGLISYYKAYYSDK